MFSWSVRLTLLTFPELDLSSVLLLLRFTEPHCFSKASNRVVKESPSATWKTVCTLVLVHTKAWELLMILVIQGSVILVYADRIPLTGELYVRGRGYGRTEGRDQPQRQ